MRAPTSITPFRLTTILLLASLSLTLTHTHTHTPTPPFKISTKISQKDTDEIFEIVETKVIEIGSALENAIPRIKKTIQKQQARKIKILKIVKEVQSALTKAEAAGDKATVMRLEKKIKAAARNTKDAQKNILLAKAQKKVLLGAQRLADGTRKNARDAVGGGGGKGGEVIVRGAEKMKSLWEAVRQVESFAELSGDVYQKKQDAIKERKVARDNLDKAKLKGDQLAIEVSEGKLSDAKAKIRKFKLVEQLVEKNSGNAVKIAQKLTNFKADGPVPKGSVRIPVRVCKTVYKVVSVKSQEYQAYVKSKSAAKPGPKVPLIKVKAGVKKTVNAFKKIFKAKPAKVVKPAKVSKKSKAVKLRLAKKAAGKAKALKVKGKAALKKKAAKGKKAAMKLAKQQKAAKSNQ